MKLSTQQRTFFETFGYLGFPGHFADEADAITAEFERLWVEHGGGPPRAGARLPAALGPGAIH